MIGYLALWSLLLASAWAKVVSLFESTFDSIVVDNSETWIVEFFSPRCAKAFQVILQHMERLFEACGRVLSVMLAWKTIASLVIGGQLPHRGLSSRKRPELYVKWRVQGGQT